MIKKKTVTESEKNAKVEAESHVITEHEEVVLEKEDEKGEKKDREEELKALLEAKEKEAVANYDKFLRTQAEFENYKKRIEREKTDMIRFCNENIMKEFLPVVDNLEMALKHGKDSNNLESLMEGVEMVLKQFMKSLEKFGVTSFSSIGEKFDPSRHEAMMQIEDDEYEANYVVSEFQKGYFLNDRLLRPAKVTVATPSCEPSTENGDVVGEDKVKRGGRYEQSNRD